MGFLSRPEKAMSGELRQGDHVHWIHSDIDHDGRAIDEPAVITNVVHHDHYTAYAIRGDGFVAYVGRSELRS